MTRPTSGLFSRNPFKLGFFSPNCSGGLSVTKVPERWDASWDHNRALAVMADEAGIEFILPVARWVGYDGELGFQTDTLETVTWATGLLGATSHLSVVATAHVSFMHPIVAAKQFVTMDQIGHGRFGLNIVCGWNKPEYDMFGLKFASEHKDRYAYGQEWFDIVRKLWTSDKPFDWNGTHFQLKDVRGYPKPYGGTLPPIVNAGFSEDGRDFGARNANFLLTTLIEPEQAAGDVRGIKARAATYGRDIGVLATGYVVCRPTTKEAQEYHEYYANEQADWPAVDRLMELQGLHAKSFPPEAFTLFRSRFAGGHGTYPLIGNPDEVADGLARIAAAGFAGIGFSHVNYLDEFPYFRDEVIPRLEAKGLRLPVAQARD
jgi:alkanesulfonate monooxygenase SsuD/methylene tetrahydromethanopterin reductase-like flavin-dependent oxidoreductase (luciferase family)